MRSRLSILIILASALWSHPSWACDAATRILYLGETQDIQVRQDGVLVLPLRTVFNAEVSTVEVRNELDRPVAGKWTAYPMHRGTIAPEPSEAWVSDQLWVWHPNGEWENQDYSVYAQYNEQTTFFSPVLIDQIVPSFAVEPVVEGVAEIEFNEQVAVPTIECNPDTAACNDCEVIHTQGAAIEFKFQLSGEPELVHWSERVVNCSSSGPTVSGQPDWTGTKGGYVWDAGKLESDLHPFEAGCYLTAVASLVSGEVAVTAWSCFDEQGLAIEDDTCRQSVESSLSFPAFTSVADTSNEGDVFGNPDTDDLDPGREADSSCSSVNSSTDLWIFAFLFAFGRRRR